MRRAQQVDNKWPVDKCRTREHEVCVFRFAVFSSRSIEMAFESSSGHRVVCIWVQFIVAHPSLRLVTFDCELLDG